MKLRAKDGKLGIEATQTELINVAIELLQQAKQEVNDCSKTNFTIEAGADIDSIYFVRVAE